ncbi:MAG: hypothetical protein QOI02_1166, partial [Actinomycetota bacterium]|nr:hypothetical protein [Actinomycetota bacterium]
GLIGLIGENGCLGNDGCLRRENRLRGDGSLAPRERVGSWRQHVGGSLEDSALENDGIPCGLRNGGTCTQGASALAAEQGVGRKLGAAGWADHSRFPLALEQA